MTTRAPKPPTSNRDGLGPQEVGLSYGEWCAAIGFDPETRQYDRSDEDES